MTLLGAPLSPVWDLIYVSTGDPDVVAAIEMNQRLSAGLYRQALAFAAAQGAGTTSVRGSAYRIDAILSSQRPASGRWAKVAGQGWRPSRGNPLLYDFNNLTVAPWNVPGLSEAEAEWAFVFEGRAYARTSTLTDPWVEALASSYIAAHPTSHRKTIAA